MKWLYSLTALAAWLSALALLWLMVLGVTAEVGIGTQVTVLVLFSFAGLVMAGMADTAVRRETERLIAVAAAGRMTDADSQT